jgi:hypothetical protein
MTIPLPKSELHELHSVLRRAAERAERNKEFEHARKLAEELANIEFEIARAE